MGGTYTISILKFFKAPNNRFGSYAFVFWKKIAVTCSYLEHCIFCDVQHLLLLSAENLDIYVDTEERNNDQQDVYEDSKCALVWLRINYYVY